MSNLISEKLWEALEEAARLRDITLVQEALRILLEIPTTQPEQSISASSIYRVDQPKETNGLTALLGFEAECRGDLLPLLKEKILPVLVKTFQKRQFKRQHVLNELEKQGPLTEKQKNWVGYNLRLDLVEEGIIEPPHNCFLQFTESYINKTLFKDSDSAVVDEMCLYLQQKLLPSLLDENEYYPLYTVDDICAYFVTHPGNYSPDEIKQHIDKVLTRLEEKRILDIQEDRVEIGHSINSKHVTADDLKAMLQSVA